MTSTLAARKMSLTLSEDDLRPHMRTKSKVPSPSPLPTVSELASVHADREARKQRTRDDLARKEEEDKDKRRQEDLQRNLEEVRAWTPPRVSPQNALPPPHQHIVMPPSIYEPTDATSRRRFSDRRYFNWDSDDENGPYDPPKPIFGEPVDPVDKWNDNRHENCRLCELAKEAWKREQVKRGGTMSAECAHVNRFSRSQSKK